jgi:hypothetical protein
VLGPDPPPGREVEIYRFFVIFYDFGVFNRAGKTVSKIGIYALPPLKSEFYRDFINLLPNFVPRHWNCLLFDHYPFPLNVSKRGLKIFKAQTVFLLWSLVLFF